jgi:hypothetical protein
VHMAAGSTQITKERLGENSGRAYHSLNTDVVDNVICVTSIDDGVHASVDDCFEVRARRTHQVTGRGELAVYVVVGLTPWTLGANLGRHCCAVKIRIDHGRVWVRIRCGHVIYIPIS